MIKNTDTVAHWMAIAASERMLRFEAKEREQIAIESFDEERQRALREAGRVVEAKRLLADANRLLDEAFSHVRNIPLADDISAHLASCTPEGACCWNEQRNINGGCDNCGDPCI
jgi:aspartokinase-like uncharacterized kinase